MGGVPWKAIAVSSLIGSILLVNTAPQLTISYSYFRAFFGLYIPQVFLGIVWSLIIYPKLFSPFRHLPTPPGANFLFGQTFAINAEPTGVPHQRWINEVPNDGLIHYTNLGQESRLMLTTPKAISEVLVTKNYEFVKPSFVRAGIGRILGVGVLLAEGDEHKQQRKNLMPAFAFRHVKDLYPTFWSKSCEMVKAMSGELQSEASQGYSDDKKAPAIEIAQWLSRATLDIIGLAGMGQDFGAIQDPNTELSTTYRSIFTPNRQARMLGLLGLVIPFWFVRLLPFKRNFEIQEAAASIRKVARQLIGQKKEKMSQKEGRVDKDIISIALESGGFTDENLVDQMMTFLAAGHETTASAMVWAIYALCQNPEIQTRLREEVRNGLPSIDDTDTPLTSEILDKLPFLHAVCNEVLRVHSPVPITLREAACNTSILGQFVPKGTKIVVSAWGMHTSTAHWGPDAAKFDPDRWMGPGRTNNGGADSAYSFLTFIHGPRSCIGQAFAKAEFACLLAAVVGRFEVELEDKEYVVEIQSGITARPKGGLRVRMREVEGW